jgi:hypothetical protein
MEIINRIEPNTYWFIDEDFKCTGNGNPGAGCGSTLRVQFKDLVMWPGVAGDGWGSRDATVSFRCPVCDKVTDLDRSFWPENFADLPVVNADYFKKRKLK